MKKTTSSKKTLSKIYTLAGDEGFTGTLKGDVLPKDHCLIEVHGDVDSLQTIIDKIIAYAKYSPLLEGQKTMLFRIQLLLWQLGGELSQHTVGGLVKQPIDESDVLDLEKSIDAFELKLDSFQRFTHLVAIDVNETRVRTRKLERTLTEYLRDDRIRSSVYKYINRLSDYFFTLAVKIEQEESGR
ncbi:ATP:cob(I)alamin adenosyltransferase [Candidatus Woesearchaeota archaeon]|nr:ATP:cob(I)alamin adenosyltransferase [Candidatus Woesearchaeota archaeon]